MKLAFVNHTFLSGGGPDRVIYEIAERLKNKYDITILSSKNYLRIEKINNEYLPCPEIFRFPTPFPSPITVKKLRKFDVINIHYLPFIYLSLLSTKPKILTFHGWTNVPEREKTSKLLLIIREKILDINGRLTCFASTVVTVSEYLKKIAQKWNSNVLVIPNGVDTTLYRPGEDRGYILYVGRLVEYKGVHELIQIASKLGIELHIAGSGPELPRLTKLTKDLKIKDKVIFLGRIPEKDLISQYRNCSFFVSASKWEGFGIPFLEANSCGKPVIGYNRAAIPERITNGQNGFLVNNYNELEVQVRILSTESKIRKKMGSEGRKIAETYDWNIIADKYDKLFQQVRM